ncbi:MAG: polysaccharide biosynthesis protein [Clostridia bacterium]|nr:polysaccharide biosynthesis protein [Clostridia bacterium]
MIKLHIKNRHLCLADILVCFMSYAMILALIVSASAEFHHVFLKALPLIVTSTFIFVFVLLLAHLYQVDWLYAGVKEHFTLLLSCFLASTVSFLLNIFVFKVLHFKITLAALFSASALICFIRYAVRLVCKLQTASFVGDGTRILVVGAGNLAVTLLRSIAENDRLHYTVVGLVDDNPQKARQRIYGAHVLGTRNDIVRICEEKKVEEIVFAICNLPSKDKTEILDICSSTGKKVKVVHGMEQLLLGSDPLKRIRELDIEDLLDRDPIVLDNQLIQQDIFGKVVLVTGGGGSIGSELCRQIIKYRPEHLIILDVYENTTYELQNDLEEKFPSQKISVLIASVRDQKRMEQIFDHYRPEIVFHAAAHKHVPLMEYSPGEAIKNNVFGTYNTALCAKKYGARRFVMISTDKAVNPTNVMGATKRMCEMIVESFEDTCETDFVAVRFGNVLGSNGSVIPRFKKQIAAGGPVTVTDPEITRFFMTIPEAAQLVLQAAAYAKGGEIFVLDMGKPVKIYDLARKMIHLSGLKPDVDIPIQFTGLRPGEKLYEEILMAEEGLEKTAHSKIFVGKQVKISTETLNEKLRALEKVSDESAEKIKEILASVVPTYRYRK